MKDKKHFFKLNEKLQQCLEEQSDLELLLNPLINWEEKDEKYKNWLDLKYAGREFDISHKWKEKIQVEKFKKANGGDWDDKLLEDNEEKRKIFIKLSKRKEELSRLIQGIITELKPDEITLEQAKEIFK